MKFIQEEFSSTLEIKKSKFITFICPYDSFKDMMIRLKKKYPKARHFVYAYRYLNKFDQVVENSSDDGEPKGTSGRPTLNVLNGGKIINTAVIIVRFFGGIKLGTGGLVKAYSESVNQVLQNSQLIDYVKLKQSYLNVPYSLLSLVDYSISLYKINTKEKIFNEDVTLLLEASNEDLEKLQTRLPRECKLIYEK